MKRLFYLIAVLLNCVLATDSAARLFRPGGGSPPALQSQFVISPTGNDSNACSLASPCLTPGKLQTVMQTALAAGRCPTGYLRGNTNAAATVSFTGSVGAGIYLDPVLTVTAITSRGTIQPRIALHHN